MLMHENLDALSWKYMTKDGIHPSRDGASLLARNLGRHLHYMLWNVAKHRGRPGHYHKPPNRQHGGQAFNRDYQSWNRQDYIHSSIPLKNRYSPFGHRDFRSFP